MSELANLESRLAVLEAESAIRKVITRYFALCETLAPDCDLSELGDLFAPDAVWRGKGAKYTKAFGEQRGRDAIVAMMGAHCDPPHFAMNAHFLSNEAINVSGHSAHGHWMLLQTSTYRDGSSDLRSARISVNFGQSDGRWRIAVFETENIFARPIDHWDSSMLVSVPQQT